MNTKNRTYRGGAFSLVEIIIACAIIALLAALTLPNASAQTSATTLGTFRIDGSTATNVAYVIDCSKQKVTGVQIVNQMATSSTAAQSLVYSSSIDGINYTTTLTSTNITPVASAQGVFIIPIDTTAFQYVKINYYTNAGAANAFSTNTISFLTKIGAP